MSYEQSFLEAPSKPKYTKSMHQIFSELTEAKNDQDRVMILNSNNSAALRKMLKILFDDKIQINTPVPDYKPDNMPEPLSMSSLYIEHRRLWPFQLGNEGTLPPKRLTALFIQLLESLPAGDATLLVKVMRKDVHAACPGLTKTQVEELFPDLLDGKLTRD